ncbi:MAG TPA: sensor domain-containing diguanylate cyclase [Candidatus Methylomirabilis sp.]|nr:sensor domain-containing diguanylate cyclase [Candidatus Methylomirabilis sp.]
MPTGTTTQEQDWEKLRDQLRDNERIWSGFRQIEVRMIGSHSLTELIRIITQGIPQTFPGIDCVTLACVDPEYEMTRLLENGEEPDSRPKPFMAIPRESLDAIFTRPWRPRLGAPDELLHKHLFGGHPCAAGSVALAPLIRRGELIGSLNQGSRDPGHFVPDIATDLLEHLAAVAALCVDNAVNQERLKLDGLTDPLTGVSNRRFFGRRLAEEVERWARQAGPLVCMLVDVDFFKQVNDQYGHQVGDRVLRQIASLLGQDLRGSDVLARYGGEEFVLLLPGTTAAQGAAIAERLRSNIQHSAFVIPEGVDLDVTVSIGMACLEPGVDSYGPDPAGRLFQQVDAALYAAKQSGRNRVVQADHS